MQKTVCRKEFSTESYSCFCEGVYSCPDLQQIKKSADSFLIKAMRTIQRTQDRNHTSLQQGISNQRNTLEENKRSFEKWDMIKASATKQLKIE